MKFVWPIFSVLLLASSCATTTLPYGNAAGPSAQKPSASSGKPTYFYQSPSDVSKAITEQIWNDGQTLTSIELTNPSSDSIVKVNAIYIVYSSGLIEKLACKMSSDTLLPQTSAIGQLNYLLYDYSFLGRKDMGLYKLVPQSPIQEFRIVSNVSVDGNPSFVSTVFHLHYHDHATTPDAAQR